MNKKTRTIFALEIILIVLTLLTIFSSSLIKASDSDAEINRTWTKAICDSDNYCQDYEIRCYDNNFISMNPTGAIIHFSDNWKDPRTQEMVEKLC